MDPNNNNKSYGSRADSLYKDPTVLKVILLMCLFVITFLFALIPFALRKAATQSHSGVKRRRFAAVFGLLSCFGGGVFLATCLLDLLPAAHEKLERALTDFGGHLANRKFPIAEFLVAIGFFLVLMMEQLVIWFKERKEPSEGYGHSHHGGRARGPTILHSISTDPDLRPPQVEFAASHSAQTTNHPNGHQRAGDSSAETMTESTHNPTHHHDDDELIVSQNVGDGFLEGVDCDIHFNPNEHSTMRVLVLVLALSMHAVFEGLALGLMTSVNDLLQVFGALCIHKTILGFSLGLRLVQSKLTNPGIALCCMCFAIMAPIGGIAGVAVIDTVSQHNANMVSGSLQAIACGTFLYVTAFEILPHELNEKGFRLWKLVMMVCGYAVISIFVLLLPD